MALAIKFVTTFVISFITLAYTPGVRFDFNVLITLSTVGPVGVVVDAVGVVDEVGVVDAVGLVVLGVVVCAVRSVGVVVDAVGVVVPLGVVVSAVRPVGVVVDAVEVVVPLGVVVILGVDDAVDMLLFYYKLLIKRTKNLAFY